MFVKCSASCKGHVGMPTGSLLGRREAQKHTQSWCVSGKGEIDPVQRRDRCDKAEAEPVSRRRAACFQAIEALENLRTRLLRDPGPVIGGPGLDNTVPVRRTDLDRRSTGRMPNRIL